MSKFLIINEGGPGDPPNWHLQRARLGRDSN